MIFNTGPGGIYAGNNSYVRFASPAALPSGTPVNTTAYFAGFHRNGTQDQGFLFTGSPSGTTYTLNNTPSPGAAAYKIALGSIGTALSGGGMIGASGGNVLLRSDVLIHRDNGASMNLVVLSRDNSNFTLGDATQSVRFQNTQGIDNAISAVFAYNASATTTFNNVGTGVITTLIKRGEGTVTLGNVEYTLVDGTPMPNPAANATASTSSFVWQIGRAVGGSNAGLNANFDGALRGFSTFADDPSATFANSLFANGQNFVLRLRGGVYEVDANGGSPRNMTLTLGTANGGAIPNVNWGTGGGGFSAFGGPVSVSVTGALTWAATNFVPNNDSLLFGSSTANDVVTFTSNIGLAAATREIRVLDNPNSPSDAAVYSGILSGAAGSNLIKSGAGTLTLTNTNTYIGTTSVNNGRLNVGATPGTGTAGTLGVTVNTGATLGGMGTVPSITSLGGTVSPGVAASTGILTSTGGVTLDNTSTFTVRLNGATPGTGHDQLITGGLFTPGNANLNITTNGFAYSGEVVRIAQFGSIDSSTFNGLPNGSSVPVGAFTATINYGTLAGHTDAVTLSFTPIPEPGTILGLTALGFAICRVVRRRLK